MATEQTVYKCPLCLRCSPTPMACSYGFPLLCEVGEPGSDDRKPMIAPDGRILTRSPRWWVMAARRRRAWRRSPDTD